MNWQKTGSLDYTTVTRSSTRYRTRILVSGSWFWARSWAWAGAAWPRRSRGCKKDMCKKDMYTHKPQLVAQAARLSSLSDKRARCVGDSKQCNRARRAQVSRRVATGFPSAQAAPSQRHKKSLKGCASKGPPAGPPPRLLCSGVGPYTVKKVWPVATLD